MALCFTRSVQNEVQKKKSSPLPFHIKISIFDIILESHVALFINTNFLN
jgi:hypothetical protein